MKTERVTLLTSPAFKTFLASEARREKVSVAELIREALKLADDVKRTGDTVKAVAQESREHDRCITRLEARWDTALALTRQPAANARRLLNKGGKD